MHSLKGLSGLFGVTRMTNLSHNLENLLDSLRLGRVELQPATLDLLFEAVEPTLTRSSARRPSGGTGEEANLVEDLIARLDRVALKKEAPPEASPWGGWELDAVAVCRCSPSTKSTGCARTSRRDARSIGFTRRST